MESHGPESRNDSNLTLTLNHTLRFTPSGASVTLIQIHTHPFRASVTLIQSQIHTVRREWILDSDSIHIRAECELLTHTHTHCSGHMSVTLNHTGTSRILAYRAPRAARLATLRHGRGPPRCPWRWRRRCL